MIEYIMATNRVGQYGSMGLTTIPYFQRAPYGMFWRASMCQLKQYRQRMHEEDVSFINVEVNPLYQSLTKSRSSVFHSEAPQPCQT